MSERRHRGDTHSFDELTYREQAGSINALVVNLGASVEAHVRKAREEGRDAVATRCKCPGQIRRMLGRIS